jgi:hypothetical protein
MRFPLCVLLLCTLISACSKKKPEAPQGNVVAHNDFENLEGWIPAETAGSLTQEAAHSGTTALKVGPGLNYSMSYSSMLGKFSKVRPNKIRVAAWGLLPTKNSNPVLVTELVNPTNGTKLIWEGVNFGKDQKYGRWIRRYADITLPPEATYDTQIFVYAWNNGGIEPAYVDDLEITILE